MNKLIIFGLFLTIFVGAYITYAYLVVGCDHWLVNHKRTKLIEANPYYESLSIFYCTRCKQHYIQCEEEWGMEFEVMGDITPIPVKVYERLIPIFERDGWEREKTYTNLEAVKDVLVEHEIKFYEWGCKGFSASWLSPMMQVFGLTGDPPYPHLKEVSS